jgi:GTP cyclohydrolase I
VPNETAEKIYCDLLRALGADIDTPGSRFAETAAHASALLVSFFEPREEPEINLFPVQSRGSVSIEGLAYHSLCEHHMVPFFGTVDIRYEPKDHVAGFGGFQRCVAHFARRPQLQERLTEQVADFLFERLSPIGLEVVTTARQLCHELNGGTPGTLVTVSTLRGTLQCFHSP